MNPPILTPEEAERFAEHVTAFAADARSSLFTFDIRHMPQSEIAKRAAADMHAQAALEAVVARLHAYLHTATGHSHEPE